MKQKLLFMLTAAILSLLPFSARAANVITMTVKTAGETLDLYIRATGAVTIDGATGTYKPDAWVTYTTTAKTITVTGDVTTLVSSQNDVTALDVSRNTVLTVLKCYYCQLTALDVSHNTALTTLWCYNNALTSLDVGRNTALTTLYCNDNKLTALDVSHNTALTRLDCYNNQIKGAAMDALVASLPDRSGQTTKGTLAVFYNNADGNVMSTIQVADAKARGWNATDYNLQAYAGSTPPTITMTTTKAAGKTISLGIEATGSVTLTGVSEAYTAGQNTYTLTAPTVTLTGNVTALDCFNDSLTALDVSNNTALTTLNCYSNQLTALDVSKLTALTALNCCKNQLAAIDVSHNTALTTLNCGANQLTTLDVGHNTALSTLQCYSNQLTTLDVSMLTALTYLMCGDNLFATLDVSHNTALSWLECTRNQLTALDVSKLTALTTLTCATNQLTALDLSHNTALSWLACQNNQLTALDLSHNTALTTLTCYNNPLAALDLSHNTALTSLECYGCQFKGTVMDALIASLPDRTGAEAGKFTVASDKELDTNRNICTTTQVDAARAKNWNSFYYSNANSAYLDYSGERQYVITMTTAKAVGKTINFIIKSTGDITLTGVSEAYSPQRDTYTLTAPTVTITGAVTILSCSGDSLTALDVSQNSLLQELWCSNNLLTALDVSHNTALTELYCYGCQFKGAVMDALIASLPDRTGAEVAGKFVVVSVQDTEANQNICTTTQVAAAKAKNWGSYEDNSGTLNDYAGSAPTAISSVQTDDTSAEPAAIYDLSGRRIPQMQHGVNIVKMSNGQTRKVIK
jgi:Leucine-rich repeat (LRR) protein